jgi:hypothetical protein
MVNPDEARQHPLDEPPPFGRSWTMLYAIVLANLALWILLFTLFSRHFR